ncbi:MAG: GNAT family N-acetyltransferase [Nitrospirales bacterium]
MPMKWVFLKGQEVFPMHREQWDALNSSIHNHILLDSDFWIPLVRLFGHDELYLGISDSREYPGMILVEQVGSGQWRTFQPAQAPLGPMLLANPENVEVQLRVLLRSLPGLALSMGITQQDPDYSVLRQSHNGSKLEFLDYITTPRISVFDTFEVYWKARGKDLVGNLARRRKRLNEQGVKVSLSVDRTAQGVPEGVHVYGEFESSGWKGAEGSAVRSSNAQGEFYRDMLARFCKRGEGVIYQLFMGDQPIASNLCVERNGMLILLKTAYNEEYKKLSPSYMMLEDMLKQLFAEKNVQVLEFYGRAKEWHKKWASEERTMYHVNYYRNAIVSQTRKVLKTQRLWSGKKG